MIPPPGTIDQSDYDYWKTNFGATGGASTGSASGVVPEPSSVLLVLTISSLLYVVGKGRKLFNVN